MLKYIYITISDINICTEESVTMAWKDSSDLRSDYPNGHFLKINKKGIDDFEKCY